MGTRLRLDKDEQVLLQAVEKVLTQARAADLVAAQRGEKANDRYKVLTARFGIHSRYAGTICVVNDAALKAAKELLWADRKQLTAAIKTVKARVALPSKHLSCGCHKRGCKTCGKGYPTEAIRVAKRQRLDVLRADLAAVTSRLKSKDYTLCLGGKRLANTRHHLKQAGMTEAQWREQWERQRAFFGCVGNKGASGGNPCLSLERGQGGLHYLTVSVPKNVQRQLGVPARVRLRHPVPLHHHATELEARLEEKLATRLDISREAETRGRRSRDKMMLRISWVRPAVEPLTLQQARLGGLLAVDLNADHLAVALLDQDGNPKGQPHRIELDLKDETGRKLPASLRDARLRDAISQVLRLAQAAGVRTVAIEDLGFTGETTREKHGRKKQFRKMLSGFPTLQFRERLAAMTATAGLALVTVDPRYTSKVGGRAWQRLWTPPAGAVHTASPLAGTSQTLVSRHAGAAVAIGRRALAHGLKAGDRTASRRPVHAPERRTAPHQQPGQSVSSRPARDGSSTSRTLTGPAGVVRASDASDRPSTATQRGGQHGVMRTPRPTGPASIPEQAGSKSPSVRGRGAGGPAGRGRHLSPGIGSPATSAPS